MTSTNGVNLATYDGPMDDRRAREPEITKKAQRMIIPPSYKVRILKEYNSLAPADKAALLRREGLHTSHVSSWRRAFEQGGEDSLSSPRGKRSDPVSKELAELKRGNEWHSRRLGKAKKVIEVQGKLSALLDELPPYQCGSRPEKFRRIILT